MPKNRALVVMLALAGALFLGVLVVSPLIYLNIFFLQRSFLFGLIFWITMAVGVNIIYGYTGYLPFGYVAFFGVGAYVSAALWSRLGIPIVLAILLGGLGGVLLALIFAPTLRLRGIYFSTVNFACAMTLKVLAPNIPPKVAGGVFGISLSGIYNPLVSYYLALLLMLGAILTVWQLSRSKLGVALKCIRDDPEAAEVMGINVAKCRLQAWLLAALFPSLAGGLNAWYTAVIDPPTAFNLLITVKAIIYAMFGGLGMVFGPIVGATVLYVIDEVIWIRFPFWNLFILGLVLVLLVLFLPKGLLGTLAARYPQWRVSL
jgi:branched-chain amino acid transport system permease protein